MKDGWTDGRTNKWTNRRTKERLNRRANGWTNGRTQKRLLCLCFLEGEKGETPIGKDALLNEDIFH